MSLKVYLQAVVTLNNRRRRHHVASLGRRVTPPWPRRMACLQRLAGTDPVSLRSWSVQRARGRPGRRLQSGPHQLNDQMIGWLGNVGRCVLEVGTPWVSRAMWPNTNNRRLLMKSIKVASQCELILLRLWHAETSVCAGSGVGTSCGKPPTFYHHTKIMSKFLQHITLNNASDYMTYRLYCNVG